MNLCSLSSFLLACHFTDNIHAGVLQGPGPKGFLDAPGKAPSQDKVQSIERLGTETTRIEHVARWMIVSNFCV